MDSDIVTLVFHKSDLDGQCSAAIARLALDGDNDPDTLRMLPADYGEPFFPDQFPTGSLVYFLDWAPQPRQLLFDVMERATVVVVDHHKTNADLPKYLSDPHAAYIAAQNARLAACEVAAELFDVPACRAIKWLGAYDAWRDDDPEWETVILPFQYGMRSLPTDPTTVEGMQTWREVFQDDQATIDRVMLRGQAILAYQTQQSAEMMKAAFPLEFEGLRFIVHIGSARGSAAFRSVWDPEKYDAMMAINNVRNTYWRVQMYTDKPGLDLSEIAQKYGGGGHAQACGFQTASLCRVLGSRHACRCGSGQHGRQATCAR